MIGSSSLKSMEKVSGFTPSSGELISHLDSMRNNKEDPVKEDA